MEVEDKSRHAFTKLVEQSKNSPLLLYKLSFSQMCSQACKHPQLFLLSFYVYAVGIIMHSSNNALHVYHWCDFWQSVWFDILLATLKWSISIARLFKTNEVPVNSWFDTFYSLRLRKLFWEFDSTIINTVSKSDLDSWNIFRYFGIFHLPGMLPNSPHHYFSLSEALSPLFWCPMHWLSIFGHISAKEFRAVLG